VSELVYSSGLIASDDPPTPEQLAEAAAEADREAKRVAIRADVAGVVADLKSGVLTFGSNDRDRAVKRVARACRFLLTGDTSE
jgi:hypothetical protein